MDQQNDITTLNKINYPSDLKGLSIEELETLCSDLRKYIIDELSANPGHFASSLGTVELTVALHYLYNTPYDKIVWDVGHQAYSHKILTGRKESFHSNRQFGGLSGFPSPDESEYDAFIAGHASTSISAALGMAVASQLKNEGRHVVAVIGDGSMTGGLAYEGLNNANSQPNDLLIILNDNDMAIDDNVGGLRDYLVKMTTSETYNRVRNDVYQTFKKGNLITEKGKNFILRFNNSLKSLLTKQQNLFEGFNIRYFGPIDGNDLRTVIRVLNNIKDLKGPKLLHIHTVKGKGFRPAELSAAEWHAPGKFDKDTGQRIVVRTKGQPLPYQDIFGHTLVEMAEKDTRIVGVTPAMPSGCSMSFMMKAFPERAFDVGIAEAHAVTFSAGMATDGLIPFCNVYSSFMQRAYDQVIHDVALQKLHVIMCLDRAGLVGEDGPTHHGVFDLAYMRPIPNLIIASPYNEHYLRHLMLTAAYGNESPFVIRYPRGQGELSDWDVEMRMLEIGKGRKLREGKDLAVLSIGPIGNTAAKAIELLEKKGYSIAHYDMIFLKPIDKAILDEVAANFSKVMTIENGVVTGGLGSAVLEYFAEKEYNNIEVVRVGIEDEFIPHGSIKELNRLCRLDIDGLTGRMSDVLPAKSLKQEYHSLEKTKIEHQ